MNDLSGAYTRRRAQHPSAHAISHERADTYGVAFKVERPMTRPFTSGARGLKCALLRVRRRNRSRACGLAQERPRGHTRRDARNTRPCTRYLSSVLAHAPSLSESSALSLTRPTTGSVSGLNRALLRVCGRALSHTRPRTRALLRPHMRRGAQHAPLHALSHERADTCVVAVKVECTVAYAAGHQRRTRPGCRVLACAQTQALLRARPRT